MILFHEYAHHVMLSNVDVFMPGWAQEGLAEMFATAKLEPDGGVIVGDKNDARATELLSPGGGASSGCSKVISGHPPIPMK